LPPQETRVLDYRTPDGLLVRGGTILGTANHGRFSAKVEHGETRDLPRDLLQDTERGADQLGLRASVCVGGNGTLTIAQQFHEHGIPVVCVAKTIDNDLAATAMTFEFDSAVACATDAIDRLHTTAESHERVMVLEVMGRYAGWIAVYAGVVGGADVILIPEIPFSYESVCAKIVQRDERGKRFSIVVVAEGAKAKGGGFVTLAPLQRDREAQLGGIGAQVAQEILKRTGRETRALASATFNVAVAPPTWTARCARSSAPSRSSSSPASASAGWSPSRARSSRPCRSRKR
jgi:6-phosphofructokinase 1